MTSEYKALHFREWPCQTVSLDEPVSLWADRDALLKRVIEVLDYLSNNNSTSLHLLWADWGCGKSHTLRYMEYLCLTKYPGIFPLYSRMPDNVKGFTEVYQAIVKSINFAQLTDMVRGVISTRGEAYLLSKVLAGRDEFLNVFKSTLGTSATKSSAQHWLCGDKISSNELKAIGAYGNLKTDADGIEAIECIARLIINSGKYKRFLLMIDEYQLLHRKSPGIESRLNSGLHKLYDAVSKNLSIILSFSFEKKKDVYLRLSGELQSREDRISISIPEMSNLDAQIFVMELFKMYRTNDRPPSSLYPLKVECLDAITADIKRQQKKLNPREIIHHLAPILNFSRKKAEDGVNPEVNGEEAATVLSSYNDIDE